MKPSEFARIALLVVAAFAAIAPAASAAQPAEPPTADVRDAACETDSLSRVFAPWEDRALYTLAPGGDFETAAAGWTLDGAALVADSSPFLLGAALGAGSVELGAGASALSPPICVEHGYPTFRFMARSVGADAGVVTVELVYEDGGAQPVGQVMPDGEWAPTRRVSLAQGRSASGSVQLHFAAVAGTVRVDDVYIDPRYTGSPPKIRGEAPRDRSFGGEVFRRRPLRAGMCSEAPTILLVEDDPVLRTFLADNLTADGYDVTVAEGVGDGLRELEYGRPDLAIVDLGLPDGSGLDLIGRVRAADGVASRLDPRVPLVVLSGRATELDRVRGFERGADDFVPKPFSYGELRLRLAAMLRRTGERQGRGRLSVGALELDPAARDVRLHGRPVALSQKEFALLRALMAEPTRVLTKEELLRDVWGFRTLGTTRTLDSHACRLRQKLSVHGDRFVINVWGVGYRLVDGPPTTEGRGELQPFPP